MAQQPHPRKYPRRFTVRQLSETQLARETRPGQVVAAPAAGRLINLYLDEAGQRREPTHRLRQVRTFEVRIGTYAAAQQRTR